MSELHIFAVNTAIDARHTYLSRSKGEAAALPDLAGWMGLRQGGLNTDEIELFPISDLAGMALSDYVSTAFDLLEAPSGQTAARINALDGHVLLVPDRALAGDVALTSQLTKIASLSLAEPDHSADALQPTPVPAPDDAPHPVTAPKTSSRSSRMMYAMIMAFFIALVIVIISELS